MKFSDLRLLQPVVQENIKALGFNRPTDIQFKAIPHILEGEDIMAIAQTGTGKTAAFAIPAVSNLMRRPRRFGYRGVRCVVMEPTHELAAQVAGVIKQLAKGSDLCVVAIHGGVDQDNQIALLKGAADIIVATPGRLFDLASQGHLILSQAEMLVVDEADHMLALGFYDDIAQLVRKIPRRRQTLFFSATIDAVFQRLLRAFERHFFPIQDDGSLILIVDAEQAFHQGGFPRAVLPHQCMDGTGTNGKRYAVKCLYTGEFL